MKTYICKIVTVLMLIFLVLFSSTIISIGIYLVVFVIGLIPSDILNGRSTLITTIATVSSGAMTLFGVYWTIKIGEKNRRDDLAIQYQPRFKVKYYSQSSIGEFQEFKEKNDISIISPNIIFNNCLVKNTLFLGFLIENVGRGEALEFKYEEMFFVNSQSKTLHFDVMKEYFPNINVIVREENIVVIVDVSLPDNWESFTIKDNYNFYIVFSYFDLMKNKKYFRIGMVGELSCTGSQYTFNQLCNVFTEYY